MTQADLVISGVTAVTVDAERRVLNDAWIAVTGDRISEIGTGQPPAGREVISGQDLIAIPGLIDLHSHAGHGLVRGAGDGDGAAWFDTCEAIYARGSTPDFWYAEARLAQLERLQAGVTTAVTLLGGGADVMRTDSADYGDAHATATRETGLRTIMAVGPGRLPFPQHYAHIGADGPETVQLTFERQLDVSAELIARWDDVLSARTGVALVMPVYTRRHMTESGTEIRRMSDSVMALRAETGVVFTQDGHRNGSIALAADLGLVGPWSILGHSVDLLPEDIAALQASGASVAHNPSAIMSLLARCPAPELIEAGVNVCISSDASAPDRGYDMFRHMWQAMQYHRRHFRDPSILPEGKVLEMCTIDAARALGLESELGSLEIGKKADIVLVNARKAHLYPPVMPLLRLTHFAGAADVDTVIVNGRLLMQRRAHPHLNEDEVLDAAVREADLAFARIGADPAVRIEGSELWGNSKRDATSFRAAGD